MSSATMRLMETQTINADGDQQPFEAWDAGNFEQLNILIRVLKAGTSGVVRLQHAAVNRDDAYVDLASSSANLNTAGDFFMQVTSFLRFVRWRVDNGVAGSPVALIDIVAKD